LCVTKGEPYTTDFIRHYSDVAETLDAVVVIVCDDVPSNTKGFDAKHGRIRYAAVKSNGFIESVLDKALSYCETRYIFRIDDDEKFSPSLIEWLKSGAYREHDHWKFPRVHLWGDTEHFINAAPLYPDHQTRLSTKDKSGGRTTVHAGSPYGGGHLCSHPIEHHKFLIKTREQRLTIAAGYDAITPGFGSGGMLAFNDPESFYLASDDAYSTYTDIPVEPYELPDNPNPTAHFVSEAFKIANEIGMHQHDLEIRPFAYWLATRKPNGRFGGADHGYTSPKVAKRNDELEKRFPRLNCISIDSHSENAPKAAQSFIEGEQFDFLFIDGDHTYEGVKSDFEMYSPLVKPGGVIAFHDILDTAVHRAAGCEVHRFWRELPPHKAEFSIDGPWGGIGVTFK
jgi:hypothetical protein